MAKTCRHFGISRQAYSNRLHAFEKHGETGLVTMKKRGVILLVKSVL